MAGVAHDIASLRSVPLGPEALLAVANELKARGDQDPSAAIAGLMLTEILMGGDAKEILNLRCERGHRTFATKMKCQQRDEAIRAAAARFFPDYPVAAQAREIAEAWARYENSAWLRDKGAKVCPDRFVGRLQQMFWKVMKVGNAKLGEDRIRKILAP